MECFVIYLKDIEDRIDPHYHRPSFIRLADKLSERNTIRISDIANVICGPFGSTITLKDYAEEGIPLIRISNIHEDYLVYDDLVFISNEKAKSLSPYRVKENDLIISQRGTLGLAARVDSYFNEAIISANFIAIKDIQKIQPDYLVSFLSSDFGKKQLIRQTSGQVQTKITTDDIRRIRVPLIPITLQKRIVDLMQSAHELKRQKEAEAQKLLDSIDEYMLGELGIELSEIFDNQTYAIDSSIIYRNRYDPYYFNPKFDRLLCDIEKGNFDLKPLRDISLKIFNGYTPAKEEYTEEGKTILKVGCLANNKIEWSKLSYVGDEIELSKTVKDNDILIVSSAHQSDYMGKNPCIVSIPKNLKDKDIYFVGELICIRTDNKIVNPYFLLAVLRLNAYYQLINREKRGQTSHLYPEDLGNILIPVPSLKGQNKIAIEFEYRINKVDELIREATVEVEKAKAEVERLILGNEGNPSSDI
jgi:type I restriction enzyme M protein